MNNGFEEILLDEIEEGMVVMYYRDEYEPRYGVVTEIKPHQLWATWADSVQLAKVTERTLYIFPNTTLYLVEGTRKRKKGLSQFLEQNIDITRAVS